MSEVTYELTVGGVQVTQMNEQCKWTLHMPILEGFNATTPVSIKKACS